MQNEVGYLKKSLDDVNTSLKHRSDELTAERVKVSSLTFQLQEKEDKLHQLKDDLKLEQKRITSQLQSELSQKRKNMMNWLNMSRCCKCRMKAS